MSTERPPGPAPAVAEPAPEDWKPVRLAAKVIGHISQGMYRTPAGAIKELVSNAYDAGATYAKLHTGFPRFTEFTCEDDGSGIDPVEFKRLMTGGIGDSSKQSTEEERTGRFGRPVVGRLGVGLLSLAQICPRFQIVSYHAKTKKAFSAFIRFPAYTRKEVDQRVKQAAEDGVKYIETGDYFMQEIDFVPGRSGITVTTSHVRESFRKVMSELHNYGNKRFNGTERSYGDFGEYLECLTQPKLSALFHAAHYDQLLFGLALAAPLPYPEKGPDRRGTCILDIPGIQELQKALKSYNFSVEVDNIALCRPVILPSNGVGTSAEACNLHGKPTQETFRLIDGAHKVDQTVQKYVFKVTGSDETFQVLWLSYAAKVNGYSLKFSGYVFTQTTRLFPKEYQGILIRLRNVAIGQYDPNFLVYPQAEGPRFSMISSEIFVEEGLDDSLKVDRDGFNTLDPQYIRLQSYLHGLLHDIVFPAIWDEEKPRNEKRREARRKEVMQRFTRRLKHVTKERIRKVEVVAGERPEGEALAKVDTKSGTVSIYREQAESSGVLGKKKFDGIAQQVITAFEIANRESTPEKRREVFYQLLEGVFQ